MPELRLRQGSFDSPVKGDGAGEPSDLLRFSSVSRTGGFK